MTRLRYHLAVWLFDLAAAVYPHPNRGVGQAHHVGRRFVKWFVSEPRVPVITDKVRQMPWHGIGMEEK